MSSARHASDLIGLIRDVIGLVQEQELEKAAASVQEATRRRVQILDGARAEKVGEINKALLSARMACDRLRDVVRELPPDQRLFAEVQIEQVIEEHFAAEMSELRKKKRALSKPE